MSAARRGRAARPLSFRDQFFQDETIALGIGIVVSVLAGLLHDAHVISSKANDWSLTGVALPAFAVSYWHAGWRPVPPPPASRARRALTITAAVLVTVLLAASVAAWGALLTGGRMGWSDFPFAAVPGAYLSLSAARRGARRWGPVPRPEATPEADAAGTGAVENGAAERDSPRRVPASVPPWGPAVQPPGS